MDYRSHLSPTLQWKWHFQDFRIIASSALNDETWRVTFVPRFTLLYPLVALAFPTRGPLILLTSLRLGCIASIIAAGHLLGKHKKDGEVIVREQSLDCPEPVICHRNVRIDVDVHIELQRSTDRYDLMTSTFEIGDGKPRHYGRLLLFYCRPDLNEFSYLGR